ncbi:MAG TPA: xanthine dehydrogenase family protein molybdopterin-binding subunit [Vineibacter sp.]|nr:xanthine dehydrogenase family protein molybdopterin-binding subunit [Vineibacter sp.]
MGNVAKIGERIKRTEDRRFLTGSGRYVDDLQLARCTYAYFLRSPHAHARIKSIDIAKAKAAPGVVEIFIGKDIADAKVGGLPCGWVVKDKHGQPHKAPAHPPMAVDTVRYVGDTVAMVIAATQAEAKDAAEQIVVDYEVLPAIIDPVKAVAAGAVQVHADAPGNLSYDWELGVKADIDAAFAKAAHVTKLDLVNNRLVPNAMEPRAAAAEYDRGTGNYTLYTTSQNPHVARLVLSAFVLGIPEHKLRVVAPDVGGGFGSKIFIYADETLVLWAAGKVQRPIKWTAERSESFMTDAHGRDHVSHAELALDKDGKFLALKVDTIANMGAYLSTFATCVPTYLYATLLAGQYTTPLVYANVRSVFTHTTPVDAYRGAGRPEATYLLETIVDKAAREMKIDPGELRRRNYIAASAFPYQTPVALTYDSGNYAPILDQAKKLADYDGAAGRKASAKAKGKLRGVGICSYIEACGIAPSAVVGSLGAGVGLWESAELRFNPTGNVQVLTGSHSHGQSHETTFAQIVSDKLGIPLDQIEVVHGDTTQVPFGMGSYGSRSLAVGGSAIMKAADKIIAKGKTIAAHLMEAAEADVVFENGTFKVAGTDKAVPLAQAVFTAYVPHNYPSDKLEPGMDENAFYDPANFTYPSGTQICEVEVDPDTGVVDIVNFVAVDDFGIIVNPMIVEGQVHGGIAQGVGQALLENAVYDKTSGQLISGSYMDYTMPRADNLPSFKLGYQVTPCPHNPLGVKGCGEAGAIAAPAAVMNAVRDALAQVGAQDRIEMPATPQAVWNAINTR